MKYRLIILVSVFTCFSLFGYAQTPDQGMVNIQYPKEVVGGVNLHSNGWGGTLRYGIHKTGFSRHLFGADVVYMKHGKEIKNYNPWYEDSKGYIYGKENALYVFRPFYGQRYSFTDKIRERGVDVGMLWTIGPSLGFTKPVYLEIGHPSVPYEYITVEKYNSSEHFVDNIYGKAPGTKGLDEMKLHPGIHAKLGLLFEYSNERENVKALEVGMVFDAYAKRVPVMALTENKQFYFTLYLNLLFGKKYIR